MDYAWRLVRSRLRQVRLVLMRPLAQRQTAQGARQSFATAPSSRHWARALRGLGKGKPPQEEEAVRTGLSLGMTLIDTAEVYGSEEFIGRAIAGQRNRVFLVSKVWPSHVAGNGIMRACEASLDRLGTDHLDLYLLHWPNGVTNLSSVVTAFENLRSAAKIRAWGVSNFKVCDMEDLFRIPKGDSCATNQLPKSRKDTSI
jgi:diketogulonate reductase-like aldo/keto reductase